MSDRKSFTEYLKVHVPAGTRDAIEAACARYRINMSDYVRESLVERLKADGIPVPPVLEERRPMLPAKAA